MNDALTCPVCEARLGTRDELLAHAWKHLRYLDHNANYTNGRRACWCGLPVYAFVFWLEHMAGKDVQAHYAASLLGMNR